MISVSTGGSTCSSGMLLVRAAATNAGQGGMGFSLGDELVAASAPESRIAARLMPRQQNRTARRWLILITASSSPPLAGTPSGKCRWKTRNIFNHRSVGTPVRPRRPVSTKPCKDGSFRAKAGSIRPINIRYSTLNFQSLLFKHSLDVRCFLAASRRTGGRRSIPKINLSPRPSVAVARCPEVPGGR